MAMQTTISAIQRRVSVTPDEGMGEICIEKILCY
jgi:hypothetical protein